MVSSSLLAISAN